MIALTLYSRPGCHLCEEMKAVIRQVAADTPVPMRLDEVDIAGDAALEARYGLDIPVLLANGNTVAKHRISERELRSILSAR